MSDPSRSIPHRVDLAELMGARGRMSPTCTLPDAVERARDRPSEKGAVLREIEDRGNTLVRLMPDADDVDFAHLRVVDPVDETVFTSTQMGGGRSRTAPSRRAHPVASR